MGRRLSRLRTSAPYPHRVDRTLNMRRFYGLTLKPTLFGSASVISNWGWDRYQRTCHDRTFDETDDAQRALKRLETMKQWRGYRAPRDVSDAGTVGV
nr:WGR domain-containing protein [Aminobacter anthyllidis]